MIRKSPLDNLMNDIACGRLSYPSNVMRELNRCFGVLFETQSLCRNITDGRSQQDSVLLNKDKPSQEQHDDVIKQLVGVSNHKKPKAFGNIRFASKKEAEK
jgi:hypothetical protein